MKIEELNELASLVERQSQDEDGKRHVSEILLPPQYLTAEFFGTVFRFLEKYKEREQHQNQIGGYDGDNADAIEYLLRLLQDGKLSPPQEKAIMRLRETGVPEDISAIVQKVEDAIFICDHTMTFATSLWALYRANLQLVEAEFSLYGSSNHQYLENKALRSGLQFINTHTQPEICEAQAEIITKLAESCKKYSALVKRVMKETNLRVIEVHVSQIYQLTETDSLAATWFEFVNDAKIDPDRLVMERAPAGKYVDKLTGEALFSMLFTKDKTRDQYWEGLKEDTEDVGHMPMYQPVGHREGDDLAKGLERAKADAFAKIDKIDAELSRLSGILDNIGKSGGLGQARGGHGAIEPLSARADRWTDSV